MLLTANRELINISICICTRKRQEGLRRLLDSLENLEASPQTNVRIIVIENDIKNLSESIVKEFSGKGKFEIRYFLEPRQGIVFARNRSIAEAGECDFCCFTDDDQIVSSDWLIELLKCQREFNADGVTGLTQPSFTKTVPAYIKKFHQLDTYPYGTIVKSAFTGCLLLRKKYLDLLNGPFDVRLNFSGGEDCLLTEGITELGGKIRFNPNAIAYEFIPESRTKIEFVIKRTYRTANTRLFIKSIKDQKFKKTKELPKLITRMGYGLLIVLPLLIFGKASRLKGLIKIVNAAGGFAFVFGIRSQFYK